VVAKEIGWVGAAAYGLCSSPTLHDTSYSALQSKPQHSSVTGTHASEVARRARAPGRTDMLTRAMGITCVEDLPDRDYTVWAVKEPATVKLPTWLPLLYTPRNCQTRPHCDSLTTAEQAVVGMLCCGVRLYLIAAGHEDAQGVENCGDSCSPEGWFHLMRRDKNPLLLHLTHLRWVLQVSLSRHGCLSERMFTSKIYMYLHTVQLLAALLTLMSI